MRRLGAAFILSALMLALAACAWAEPVTLAYSFKPGQIDFYRFYMDMRMTTDGIPQITGKPFNLKMTSTLRQKVLGILPDGSAKVLITYSNVKLSSPQLPQISRGQLQPGSMTLNIASDGRVLAIQAGPEMNQILPSGVPGLDVSQLGGHLGFMGVFPSEPIEIGQSWSKDIALPFNCGTISTVSTLLGAAIPVGKDVACKIKQSYQTYMDLGALAEAVAKASKCSAPNFKLNGGMIMNGWTVLYFSRDKGKLLKANGAARADLTMNLPSEVVNLGGPPAFTLNMDMNINIAKV